MKCKKCKNPAIIFTNNSFLCKEHFNDYFEKKLKRLVKKHNLITKKDKLALAVSGGKDSLTLLFTISKLYPENEKIVININEGIEDYREHTIDVLKEFSKKLNIPYISVSFKEEFGKTLDQIVKKIDTYPCSICGVLRRYLLNKTARKLDCTKIATGHNLDDEAQSTLMNIFNSDIERLERMGFESGIVRGEKFVRRIKPLRFHTEKEIVTYFLSNNLKTSTKECPYSKKSFRLYVRTALYEYERKHPGTNKNIINFYDKFIITALQKKQKTNTKLNECQQCKEHTSTKICKVCELIKILGLKNGTN